MSRPQLNLGLRSSARYPLARPLPLLCLPWYTPHALHTCAWSYLSARLEITHAAAIFILGRRRRRGKGRTAHTTRWRTVFEGEAVPSWQLPVDTWCCCSSPSYSHPMPTVEVRFPPHTAPSREHRPHLLFLATKCPPPECWGLPTRRPRECQSLPRDDVVAGRKQLYAFPFTEHSPHISLSFYHTLCLQYTWCSPQIAR